MSKAVHRRLSNGDDDGGGALQRARLAFRACLPAFRWDRRPGKTAGDSGKKVQASAAIPAARTLAPVEAEAERKVF